jgi:hypothetical protein
VTPSVDECICQTQHFAWKYEARARLQELVDACNFLKHLCNYFSQEIFLNLGTSCPKANAVFQCVTAVLNGGGGGSTHTSRIVYTIVPIGCKAPLIGPRKRTTKGSESQCVYALSPYLSRLASRSQKSAYAASTDPESSWTLLSFQSVGLQVSPLCALG